MFGLAVALSVVILFAPESGVPPTFEGVDKVVHVTLFAALSLTGALAGHRRIRLAVALLAYAGGSELVQALPLLGRSSDWWDVLADSVGVAVGLTALAVRRRPLPLS